MRLCVESRLFTRLSGVRVASAAAVILFAVAAPAFAQKSDEAQLKGMVDGGKDPRKLSKPLAAEAQQKIEKGLGLKLDKADLPPRLYTIPAGRETFTACVTTVAGPKGPIRLAVVVGKDPRGTQSVQKVGLLAHAEDKAIADDAFLAQFLERTATPNAYNPPETLDEAAKKPDPQVKQLLDFLHLMNRNHELYNSLAEERIPKKDAGAIEDAKALSAALGHVRDQAKGFGGLLKPDEVRVFEQQAADALATAKRGEAALGKKDFVAAQSAYDELSCAKCHGSFRKTFRDRRQTLQVGDGYFKVGYDVLPAKKGAEAASQAVATGVKKALLILDQIQ